MVLPVVSLTTVASQTCVVRPPWTSLATQATPPSRAVPMKLDFSSAVVKPVAPSGSAARAPNPQAESASAMTLAACRKPLGAR